MKTAWQNCSLFSVGLPRWLSGKNLSAKQETQVRFVGWEDPLGRKWEPIPVFLPGKSHGQRSFAGYSSWSHKRVWHNLATKQTTIVSIKMASLGLTDEFNWFIKRKMTKWGKICFINIKIRLNLWHVNIFYKSITKKVQTPIRLFHKSDSSGEHICYLGPHMRHRIRGTCLHPCTYKEGCHGSPLSPWVFV